MSGILSRFFYEVRKMATEIKVYRINETEIWQGKLHKVNGENVEKAVRFILRPLNPADAEAMGKLSENIYRHLRKGEECFIHKHSGDNFSAVKSFVIRSPFNQISYEITGIILYFCVFENM